MTTSECGHTPETQTSTPPDFRTAAAGRALLAGLIDRPWGQVSPSIYETGRLIALAPWLARHSRRVRYILDAQRPDGLWGAPDGYAIVPTLSAVDALLSLLRSDAGRRPPSSQDVDIAEVAARLDALLPLLARTLWELPAAALPDMPANDLIITALIESINEHTRALAEAPSTVLSPSALTGRLRLPIGLDGTRLAKVQAALSFGAELPEKILHALEVAGDLARDAATIRPGSTGSVGASPAATAAWLDGRARDPHHPARVFLETVVDDHDGLAPCGIPITVFERAWVLSSLTRAGIAAQVPAALITSLDDALGPVGTPAAEGLPADADTTSAVLYALNLLGVPRAPDSLWAYETGTHFCTWPGEEGFSVTVNAHALEAFGQYLRAVEEGRAPRTAMSHRYAATVDKLVTLLCDRQEADGSWTDRWHASPYYATMCCVVALSRFGGWQAAPAIRRARAWTLATQRPDGSWGRWKGTFEETAYAIQVLLSEDQGNVTSQAPDEYEESVTAGCRFLPAPHHLGNGPIEGPALWHDKDLYLPSAIVQASLLAAHQLARKRGISGDLH
ncbi:prenyltransferase/squalene oxidase repeat-containing protein [Actinomadura sp. B10D3]|uniref:prenyltransferase/squalene oxidase repeat-containing protein n=1 Tax=Actinomadura sp. B10D3 TaxID=3153557 RepID=UPI00325C3A9F